MGILTRREIEPAPPLARRRSKIGEISTAWAGEVRNGLRSFRRTFWPTAPSYAGTTLSYSQARRLYRNDDKSNNLGAGFCKRIINATVDFMELPRSATGDEIVDEFLNRCIETFWVAELEQFFRDVVRDADSIVRIRRHDPENPLISPDEWESCYLEVVPPESCAIYYAQGGDVSEIEAAYIRHETEVVVEKATTTGASLRQPQVQIQVIIEEITKETYRYYNETTGKWMEELSTPNSWGFVPLYEGHNEFDTTIGGGQSDLETPLPFILAFHDVLAQSLQAHKSHAIPKAKFRVHDMLTFIANNWPEAFERDENNQPIMDSFSGEISWKGTEILFMDSEEDVDFLEATSVLGDSKVLLDFLLHCIAITSETPRSILMDQTAQDADEMIPFSKKINRKRRYFTPAIQMICKMVLAINHMEPIRVPLSWEEITPEIALKKAQVLQQNVMSHEVLATRQVVSDRTVRESLRSSIPAMKSPEQEARDAKKNVTLDAGPTSTGSSSGTDSGNKSKPGNEN